MKKTVLITGASSGIGYELGKIFARNGYNLIMVSRNLSKLEKVSCEIKNIYNIDIKIIPKDLGTSSAPQELYDEVIDSGIYIDVLVNNAGFGVYGKFTETNLEDHIRLIKLNIISLTTLCKLFGTHMVKQNDGKILNVSSIAAFQGGAFI